MKTDFSKLECFLKDFNNNLSLNKDINSSTEREAMGLPTKLVDLYSDLFSKIAINFRGFNEKRLIEIIKSSSSHYCERIVACDIMSLLHLNRIEKIPTFNKITGGKTTIGTPSSEVDKIYNKYKSIGVKRNWIEKEIPLHNTYVEDFHAAIFPVTNNQYRFFLLDSNFDELPTSWRYGSYPYHLSDHPVYTVSLKAVDAYCRWLSQKIGHDVRIPSEVEWEYLATGGAYKQYTWGNDFSHFYSNTNEILLQNTTPVGVFLESKSNFGIYDLIGNVEEYVSNEYFPYPGGDFIEDDLYKKLGNYRVAKGGAFNRFSDLARIQRRHGAYPSSLYAIGFRVCFSS